MPDPRPLRPNDPDRLGGYRLIALLGEGSRTTTYLAEPLAPPATGKPSGRSGLTAPNPSDRSAPAAPNPSDRSAPAAGEPSTRPTPHPSSPSAGEPSTRATPHSSDPPGPAAGEPSTRAATHTSDRSGPAAGEPSTRAEVTAPRSSGRSDLRDGEPAGGSGGYVVLTSLRAELPAGGRAERRFVTKLTSASMVVQSGTARVLDIGLGIGRPFVVSEYVQGDSLRDLVARHGPLNEKSLLSLASATAAALAAVHRAGIVHRDLHPGNVLLGPAGTHVVDFSVSTALDACRPPIDNRNDKSSTDHILGTHAQGSHGAMSVPGFMPPEQLGGGELGPPADIFAWAATLVFAATGRPPADGSGGSPAGFAGTSRISTSEGSPYGVPSGPSEGSSGKRPFGEGWRVRFGGAQRVRFGGAWRVRFGGGILGAVRRRFPARKTDLSVLPAALLPLVRAALDEDPARRPTAADALQTLLQLQELLTARTQERSTIPGITSITPDTTSTATGDTTPSTTGGTTSSATGDPPAPDSGTSSPGVPSSPDGATRSDAAASADIPPEGDDFAVPGTTAPAERGGSASQKGVSVLGEAGAEDRDVVPGGGGSSVVAWPVEAVRSIISVEMPQDRLGRTPTPGFRRAWVMAGLAAAAGAAVAALLSAALPTPAPLPSSPSVTTPTSPQSSGPP
ncbi:protein kinase domain-containing protein [Sphaerisporangium corydalis]|uniref:Protein kinase n=1 Tax=Sphaerisporangium corydalis TaxID=1441875 RepID=A0ABV9EIT5_9ACTN|nr:protein kinase [Sphaerisporangium corydalis]